MLVKQLLAQIKKIVCNNVPALGWCNSQDLESLASESMSHGLSLLQVPRLLRSTADTSLMHSEKCIPIKYLLGYSVTISAISAILRPLCALLTISAQCHPETSVLLTRVKH